jgi:pimeloyl-ACP methyl ester carboxylesterase
MPFISIGTERLHYLQLGTGRRLLLAFHGYGEDAEKFRVFEPFFGAEYTMLSFDLPHHGVSKWQAGIPLTPVDLILLVNTVRSDFGVDKVSLMGYSIGGRVCLGMLMASPLNIDKVLLLATDGLRVNHYYYFFTRTLLGRLLFKKTMADPAFYFRMADWLLRKTLISQTQHRLIKGSLETEGKRKLLLRAWPALSKLIFRTSRLKSVIRRYKIPVLIIMGAYDNILPPRLAERFAEGLETVKVVITEKGHRIFDADNAGQIAARFL